MSFPDDPTDLTIEMQTDTDTWVDLVDGDYVLDRGLNITRGRADEAGQIEPQKLTMTLDNTGGRFSPRNPTSPYYGTLGRNTPVRAFVARGTTYLEMPGSTDYISCPDSAGISVTGDIDIRVDLTTSYWSSIFLAGKYKTTSDQRSWAFVINEAGIPELIWTTAGTSASADAAVGTVTVPQSPGRRALRVTVDVSPTPTVTFYTSDSISGTWTQLGDSVTSLLGTGTSIYDSTAPIELGYVVDNPAIIGEAFTGAVGRFNAFELRSGIGGSVVANPTFTGLTIGATTVADSHSNTFTFQNNAQVSNKRWRFHGELSSLPPRWDTSGNDTYVTTDANGLLRRLRQAATPLHSAIYRQIIGNPVTAAYWSCEDQSSATSFAAATQFTAPGKFKPGLSLASTELQGSEALPTTNNVPVSFSVPQSYDFSNGSVAFFLLYIPLDNRPADGAVLASISTTGSANRWDFKYWRDGGAAGSLGGSDGIGVGVAKGSDEGSTYSIMSPSGVITTSINDTMLLCSIGYKPNGTAMLYDWNVLSFQSALGYTDVIYDPPFRSSSSTTGGRVSKITIDPGAKLSGVTFGHVTVWSGVQTEANSRIYNGYTNENGGDRLKRLCAEEDIPIRIIGSPTTMPAMGEQTAATLADLLQECADADHGMLFECREALSLCYRTRASLYSQDARLTLDYDDGAITGAIEPTDDDQQVRNDVTVSRDGGSSARVEKTDGPMSVLDPPDGVGRYQDSQSYNLWHDDDLPDHANWLVHLGTVDEARYPTIGIDYSGEYFTSDDTLVEDALMLEIGDRILITNPPDSLPPDDISQLVQGYGESYGNYVQQQAFNCSPASPYEIAAMSSMRVDTSGSELASDYDDDDTSLSVTTTNGDRWTTDSGFMPFDIMVGGERMTVTAISGTTTTQTFTVTRSVNGVVKSQTSGTAVNLFSPTYVGL